MSTLSLNVEIHPLIDGNVYGFFAWKTFLLHRGRLSSEWKHPNKKVVKETKFKATPSTKDKTASERHRKQQNERVIADLLRNKPKK